MHGLPDRGAIEPDEAAAAAEHTDWADIEAMTEEEAYQNALADEDNPPLTDEQLARLRRVPNPQEIRERLGLTQRQFARQFQIALGTLRDWEQGASRPDSAAKAYLRVIEHNPVAVRTALSTEGRGTAIEANPGIVLQPLAPRERPSPSSGLSESRKKATG
jgi:putative transcriptional regulator